MPKFPKPEIYIAHWFTSQWIGLAIYACGIALPYRVADGAANLKSGQIGIAPGWFLVLYIVQALVTMYAVLALYEHVREEARLLLARTPDWQRRENVHPGWWRPQPPIHEPQPFSYMLVWAYGLVPVCGLAYFLCGPAASFKLTAGVLAIVFLIGIGWIFELEREAHATYRKNKDHTDWLMEQRYGPPPKIPPGGLFSLESLPVAPHHPPHDAAAAAERAEQSSLKRRLQIEAEWLRRAQEKEEREAERIRGLLPTLEAEHLRAFAHYVAHADFDGTADRNALRRVYREYVAQHRPDDLDVLRASENPEIQAIFGAARGLR